MYVREERSVVDRVFDFTQEMYTQIIHPFIQKTFNFTLKVFIVRMLNIGMPFSIRA